MLQDLHLSLTNLDHVHHLINLTRSTKYPSGTGFEGACCLANEHASLPLEQCYACRAETHLIDCGVEFKLVVLTVLQLFEFLTLHLWTLATHFHSNIFMASGVKLSLLTATKAKDLECTVYSFHILSQHHVYMNLTNLCVAHFKGNFHALHTHVLDEVYLAMLSLAHG
ncbi:hypothetical protein BDR04DRAFT_1115385 [Suillus decipiens]|nr:hypothetical protein BDR04DRAFT_1115385 [Suillus decipiens]